MKRASRFRTGARHRHHHIGPLSGNGRERGVRATCVHGHWAEATAMVEGMLAEPWHLRGYQEVRLREFLELVQVHEGSLASQ